MSAAAAGGGGGERRRPRDHDAGSGGEAEARMDSWFPSDGDKKKVKVGGDGDLNNGKEKPSAAVEERVEMLKEMVQVLKGIDTSLRSRTDAKGSDCVPTIDEQMLLNLILGHVDCCILLHHTTTHNSDDNKKSTKKGILLLPSASRLVEQRIFEIRQRSLSGIIEPLEDVRRSITSFDPEKERPKAKDIVPYFANLGHPPAPPPLDISRGPDTCPFLAHLVDILHSLLILEQRRDYAPPCHEGDEIGCYKEIRTQLCSTLLYADARASIDRVIITSMESILLDRSYPHHIEAGDYHAPTFFSFGHMFARCFDLMQVCRSLLTDCETRLSQVIRNQQGEEAATADVIVVRGRLLRWQPEEVEDPTDVKSRLECLNIIIAKLERFLSSASKGEDLTDREIQLYAHIAEHVRASLWLSYAFPGAADRKETCMVNVAGIKEVVPIAADGDGLFTREEYLEDIMSYVRAFKPVFAAEALTYEENEAYRKIWRLIGADFPWCSQLKPVVRGGGKKEEPPALLREGLCAVFERIIEFFEEVEKQQTGMLALVLGAIVPEEAVKLKAAPPRREFELSAASKEKLEEFFRCDSTGGVELLDRLAVVLHEMFASGDDVFGKLTTAVWDFDNELYRETYAILEREMINAHNIISRENY